MATFDKNIIAEEKLRHLENLYHDDGQNATADAYRKKYKPETPETEDEAFENPMVEESELSSPVDIENEEAEWNKERKKGEDDEKAKEKVVEKEKESRKKALKDKTKQKEHVNDEGFRCDENKRQVKNNMKTSMKSQDVTLEKSTKTIDEKRENKETNNSDDCLVGKCVLLLEKQKEKNKPKRKHEAAAEHQAIVNDQELTEKLEREGYQTKGKVVKVEVEWPNLQGGEPLRETVEIEKVQIVSSNSEPNKRQQKACAAKKSDDIPFDWEQASDSKSGKTWLQPPSNPPPFHLQPPSNPPPVPFHLRPNCFANQVVIPFVHMVPAGDLLQNESNDPDLLAPLRSFVSSEAFLKSEALCRMKNASVSLNHYSNPGQTLYKRFVAAIHAAPDAARVCIVFHGTDDVNIDPICEQGLNPHLRGQNGQALGRGEYFAKTAYLSLGYCRPSRKQMHTLRNVGIARDPSVLPDATTAAHLSTVASELPLGWRAVKSSTGQEYYYYNEQTGVSQWDRPTAAERTVSTQPVASALLPGWRAAPAASATTTTIPNMTGLAEHGGRMLIFAVLLDADPANDRANDNFQRSQHPGVVVIQKSKCQLPLGVLSFGGVGHRMLSDARQIVKSIKTKEMEAVKAEEEAKEAKRFSQVCQLLIQNEIDVAAERYQECCKHASMSNGHAEKECQPPRWAANVAPYLRHLDKELVECLFPGVRRAVEERTHNHQFNATVEQLDSRASQKRADADQASAASSVPGPASFSQSLALPLSSSLSSSSVSRSLTPVIVPTTKATERITREFGELSRASSAGDSFDISLPNDDLYVWQVMLRPPSDTALARELAIISAMHGGPAEVELEVRFTGGYPSKPPFVRIVQPRFNFHTGHVTIGGSICMAELTMSGWKDFGMRNVLLMVLTALVEGDARINKLAARMPYSEQEARRAFERVAREHGWPLETPVP